MWNGVVTTGGIALLSRWAAGGTLVIDGATAGTGTMEDTALMTARALVSEVEEISIVAFKIVEGGVQYDVQFEATETAYIAQQVGIWAHLDDGERTLIAIYQNSDTGVEIQSIEKMPSFIYGFGAIVQMGNTGQMNVTVDTGAVVRWASLNEAIACMVRHDAAQDLTTEQMAQARANIGAATTSQHFLTIPADGWSVEAPYSMEIVLPGILGTDAPFADIVQTGNEETDAAMRAAWACITRIATADGSITVYAAEEKPETAIPIQLKVVR